MQLDQALTHVAVLGAAGKMGSGIALLLLQEMSKLELEKTGTIGSGAYILNLIDVRADSFPQLRAYLRSQLFKYAEKNINDLRSCFAQNKDLISNEEIIDAYVNGALDLVSFDVSLEAAKNAHLIFEAIIEDVAIKSKIFRTIVEQGNKNGFFFSNTSSIPIHILNEKAQLSHRIIGFHFYNPPVIQKLLEIIIPPETHPDLVVLAHELAKRLKKTIVNSRDVAGFIGNGHMIREITFACEQVKELSKKYSLPEAIYMVNRVTQDWLVRPMGIFQLIDYVGIDVCQHIMSTMRAYLKDATLVADLIDQMVKKDILGGQNPDGTQKNGFFSYAKYNLQGIYSLSEDTYIPLTSQRMITVERDLGEKPKGQPSWKDLQKNPHKKEILKAYFELLYSQQALGAQLAQNFLQNSCSIANKLLQDGVAASRADIDTVLMDGFYHIYGTEMCPQEVKA